MLDRHIGAFECLYVLHRLRASKGALPSPSELRKSVAKQAGGPVAGTEYFEDAIRFYDRA